MDSSFLSSEEEMNESDDQLATRHVAPPTGLPATCGEVPGLLRITTQSSSSSSPSSWRRS